MIRLSTSDAHEGGPDAASDDPSRPASSWSRSRAAAIERGLATDGESRPWSPLPATLERLLAGTATPAFLFESPGTIRAASPGGRTLLEDVREPDHDPDGPPATEHEPTLERLLGIGWAALVEAADEHSGDHLPVTVGGTGDERFRLHLEAVTRERGEIRTVLGLLESVAPRRGGGRLRDVSVRTIVGSDPEFVLAKRTAERFARTDLPILLTAETGAGKEVLARAIHDSSPRAARPFVAINCGSLSPQLLESELFGYGPGAFTGARPDGHDGKIKAAEGGTLFLDEVAEMPPALQCSLLRVLEDGSYYRVGETILRRADIRIICATWRDLPSMIHDERFRQDLYYRIKGACIVIPPLRARTDISDIVHFLLDKLCFELKLPPARFSREAMGLIKAFSWPGNIRELRSAIHHALVLGEGRHTLHPEHLPAELRPAPGDGTHRVTPAPDPRRFAFAGPIRPTPAAASGATPGRSTAADPPVATTNEPADAPGPELEVDRLEELQLRTLQRVLTETRGNLSETARRLGIARSTLYRLMERHGLREDRA